jgi:hypothetical protein
LNWIRVDELRVVAFKWTILLYWCFLSNSDGRNHRLSVVRMTIDWNSFSFLLSGNNKVPENTLNPPPPLLRRRRPLIALKLIPPPNGAATTEAGSEEGYSPQSESEYERPSIVGRSKTSADKCVTIMSNQRSVICIIDQMCESKFVSH